MVIGGQTISDQIEPVLGTSRSMSVKGHHRAKVFADQDMNLRGRVISTELAILRGSGFGTVLEQSQDELRKLRGE